MKPSVSGHFQQWVLDDMALTGRDYRDARAMVVMESTHETIVDEIIHAFYLKTAEMHPCEVRKIAFDLSEAFGITARPDPEEDHEYEHPHTKPGIRHKELRGICRQINRKPRASIASG